jgi:hypothetical protein
MLIGAISCGCGGGGTSSGGGGAGGRVVSSLTGTWFSLVFMALPEGPAERICTLANRGRKTNKKRFDEQTLTYCFY